MCTAVIEVPESPDGGIRLLAVRDEDPDRAWDSLGSWWPEHPGIVGVRDRLAGGAWLAAAPADRRLVLVLNRAEGLPQALPDPTKPAISRGKLVIDAAAGLEVHDPPGSASFNMIRISGSRATLTTWDGSSLGSSALEPGVHMIAHHDLNDAERTPRVERWLPEFRALAGLPAGDWRDRWLDVLARSAQLPVEDDRAILRDNRVHGYPTQSLLVSLAEVHQDPARDQAAVRIDSAILPEPARWEDAEFESFAA